MAEMNEKKGLYFAKGCQEFWLCDLNGNMQFFSMAGKLAHSHIMMNFPDKVQIH
jgi:hypothetical protein